MLTGPFADNSRWKSVGYGVHAWSAAHAGSQANDGSMFRN
jgi:hypothetical protein